jgi:hypothetical protein
VKFYYAVEADDPGEAVATLSDGTVVLAEKKVGEGRVLLFASTFDNVANDFPRQTTFVPFVEQTGRYLAGMEQRSPAVAVNANIELRSAREKAVPVEVVDPDGKRPLTLAESTKVETYRPDREGYYEFRRANGRHETVAVNADRRESDLQIVPKETLDLWPGGNAAEANGASGKPGMEDQQPKPWSFWWYVMLAVTMAVVAESIFASRYLGVQREEGATQT